MDPAHAAAAELAAAQAAAAELAAAQAAQAAAEQALAAQQDPAVQGPQPAPPAPAPAPPAPANLPLGLSEQFHLLFQPILLHLATIASAVTVNNAANADRTPTSSLKVPSPGTYDGKSRKECGPWLNRVLTWLTCNKADPDTPDAVRAASTLLTGPAQQWFQSCVQSTKSAGYGDETSGGFQTFRDFAEAMELFLGDPLPELQARLSLRSLAQTRSVLIYASEFQRLISYIPNIDAGTLKFDFWFGLKPKIKELLTGKIENLPTWTDIRDLAHRFDTQLYLPRSSYAFSTPTPSAPRDRRPDDPMDINSAMTSRHPRGRAPTPGPSRGRSPAPRRSQSPARSSHSPSPRLSKLTPEERDQLRAAGACFKCRKHGHIAANCPMHSKN